MSAGIMESNPGFVVRLFDAIGRCRIVATQALAGALVMTALATGTAWAQTGTYNPETPADPATEARLKNLALELRCLVCQNQTIADSNADLAVDLRREVREQMLQGRTDDQIKQYLVARYGDFVLYKPPVQANTTLLWFGPFALLVVGAFVWWLFVRRRNSTGAPAPFSDVDERKAKALLEDR
jgi:cytochrome c-type biogenesis protein CcmH